MEQLSVIKKETNLVRHALRDAAPLILDQHLVKVRQSAIRTFEQSRCKTLPPDLKYWLRYSGTGFIDFPCGTVRIPSIKDLIEADNRLVDPELPLDCAKRIYPFYGSIPDAIELDVLLTSKEGLCPVIITYPYDETTDEVIASSWPRFLLSEIVTQAKLVYDKAREYSELYIDENDELLITAEKIMLKYGLDPDPGLPAVRKKALINNHKLLFEDLVEPEEAPDPLETEKNDPVIERMLDAMFAPNQEKIKTLDRAMELIEQSIHAGDNLLLEAADFVAAKVKKKQIPELKLLMGYHCRDVREMVLERLLKLDASKKAKKKLKKILRDYGDWDLIEGYFES